MCGKSATKRCQRCKCVRYCNAECQRLHWKAGHRHRCYNFDNVLFQNTEELKRLQQHAKEIKVITDLKNKLLDMELGFPLMKSEWLTSRSESYAMQIRQFITSSSQTICEQYLNAVNEFAASYTECFDIRQRFVTTVSWSLMTYPHIQIMESFIGSKLCRSIGSGKGWIESMLQCEIECVDIEADEAFIPTLKTPSNQHADTLLLSWPPREDPMAYWALGNHVGSKFMFIGEKSGLTATQEFHDKVAREWKEIRCVPLPNWSSMGGMIHAHLYMFERDSSTVV